MSRTNNSAGRIEIYQVLRYIAAVGILIYHSGVVGEHLYCGVDIFLVLSGYITMLSTEALATRWEHDQSIEQRVGCGNTNHSAANRFCVTLTFWFKRMIRILPLYYVATILMFVIVRAVPEMSVMTNAEGIELIKSMLCIPHINSLGNLIPVFGAGWTVDCEMSFYLVFGAAMMISMKYRGVITAGIIICLHLLCNLHPSTSGYYYQNGIMLEFIWGIALYAFLQNPAVQGLTTCKDVAVGSRNSAVYGWMRYMMMLAIMAITCYLVLDVGAGSDVMRAIRIGIPTAILVGTLYILYGMQRCPVWLVRSGDASFSFYLIEYYIAASYKVVTAGQGYLVKGILLIFAVLLTTGLAHVSYRLMELPCARAGYRLSQELMRDKRSRKEIS